MPVPEVPVWILLLWNIFKDCNEIFLVQMFVSWPKGNCPTKCSKIQVDIKEENVPFGFYLRSSSFYFYKVLTLSSPFFLLIHWFSQTKRALIKYHALTKHTKMNVADVQSCHLHVKWNQDLTPHWVIFITVSKPALIWFFYDAKVSPCEYFVPVRATSVSINAQPKTISPG